MRRADLPTRKLRLGEPEDDAVLRLSPSERVAMVWPLTVEAWTLATGHPPEERIRRDVGRVIRGAIRRAGDASGPDGGDPG